MNGLYDRTEIVIGKQGLDKLNNSTVAVFGIGGVGSFAVESLARAGVENIVIVDFDTVDITNVNRQIHALSDTLGKSKVEVIKDRINLINSDIKVTAINKMYNAETAEVNFDFKWDYVIDAIDMVSSKIDLIERCSKLDIPIISSMGTGNKIFPEKFQIIDIYKTHTCPLAKIMRKELRIRGVKKLNVCFSDEIPIFCNRDVQGKKAVGSMSFVPPVVGMICAGKVIRDLIGYKDK